MGGASWCSWRFFFQHHPQSNSFSLKEWMGTASTKEIWGIRLYGRHESHNKILNMLKTCKVSPSTLKKHTVWMSKLKKASFLVGVSPLHVDDFWGGRLNYHRESLWFWTVFFRDSWNHTNTTQHKTPLEDLLVESETWRWTCILQVLLGCPRKLVNG